MTVEFENLKNRVRSSFFEGLEIIGLNPRATILPQVWDVVGAWLIRVKGMQ